MSKPNYVTIDTNTCLLNVLVKKQEWLLHLIQRLTYVGFEVYTYTSKVTAHGYEVAISIGVEGYNTQTVIDFLSEVLWASPRISIFTVVLKGREPFTLGKHTLLRTLNPFTKVYTPSGELVNPVTVH